MPKFHTQVKTAREEARLLAFIPAVENELAHAVQQLANHSVHIYQAYAPSGPSGRLGRGIRAVSAQGRVGSSGRFSTGRQFAIIATARNRSGYDYVGVTRFGHRNAFISPRVDRERASVVSTRKARRDVTHHEGLPALAIPSRKGGPPIFRHQVRGFHPPYDWADVANEMVKRETKHVSDETRRRIEIRFNS